mmetsp:Transcript_29270/g.52116  ORF Transcript_29270/g.52116 Transcript_29270/m.52116 type:complete len:211 (+) Transcript_29270:108-740(+)
MAEQAKKQPSPYDGLASGAFGCGCCFVCLGIPLLWYGISTTTRFESGTCPVLGNFTCVTRCEDRSKKACADLAEFGSTSIALDSSVTKTCAALLVGPSGKCPSSGEAVLNQMVACQIDSNTEECFAKDANSYVKIWGIFAMVFASVIMCSTCASIPGFVLAYRKTKAEVEEKESQKQVQRELQPLVNPTPAPTPAPTPGPGNFFNCCSRR